MIEENNKELVYPLKNKVETLEEDNSLFKEKILTLSYDLNETRQTATFNKDKAIEYIDGRIEEATNLLETKRKKAEAYMNDQVENKTKLEIERGKIRNEIEKFGPIDKATKSKEYNSKILDLSKKISECDSNISEMNEGFRSFSNTINKKLEKFYSDKQSILDRKIITTEEILEILNPLKNKINFSGLGLNIENTVG